MPIVHLTCLSPKLIEFRPHMLSRFPKEVTSMFNICRGVQIHTVIFVVLNMNQRDKIPNIPHERGFSLKMWIGLEALNSINTISTGDVIRQ